MKRYDYSHLIYFDAAWMGISRYATHSNDEVASCLGHKTGLYFLLINIHGIDDYSSLFTFSMA